MSPQFWIIQALGLATTIITIISFYQKEKWKALLCMSITNCLLIATYALCGTLLSCLLVVGALTRTLVYSFYTLKNKQPDIIYMLLFQVYFVIISVTLFESPIDILMVTNLIVLTYTSWQNNFKIMRLGYVVSAFLLVPFDIVLGAYTTALSEFVMLIFVSYELFKSLKATKAPLQIAGNYFLANKNFWKISIENFGNFDLVSSTIDKSSYYNFCIVKNSQNMLHTLQEIQDKCKKNSIKQIAYFPFNSKKFDHNTKFANTMELFFPIEFHDVWMKLVDGFNLNNTKAKIEHISYKKVDNDKIEDVIDVFVKGYLEVDLKKISKQEQIILDNLKASKFNQFCDGIKISAFVAYFEERPVSLVVTLSNKVEAFVTKVCTIPKLRRKHLASSLIQFAIENLRKEDIQTFFLVTDKNSVSEKFYAYNNFKEFGQAFALDISNCDEYETFLGTKTLQ